MAYCGTANDDITVFHHHFLRICFKQKLNVEVDFVRIDGVVVQETVDVRREVLLKNVRQRQALGQVDEGDENE